MIFFRSKLYFDKLFIRFLEKIGFVFFLVCVIVLEFDFVYLILLFFNIYCVLVGVFFIMMCILLYKIWI